MKKMALTVHRLSHGTMRTSDADESVCLCVRVLVTNDRRWCTVKVQPNHILRRCAANRWIIDLVRTSIGVSVTNSRCELFIIVSAIRMHELVNIKSNYVQIKS